MAGLLVPKIECTEQAENFGRFVAEPLEKGFGITLGNSLRRVLLGYLPGAAVTQVRIDGVQHEFTVIPNAKEDVIEFLLNVKEIRLKPLSDHGGTLILEKEGEGRVCASDIKPSTDFEITNPELCLITLNSAKAKLYVEMDVELGAGFRPAESTDNMPVGTIPVDAIFTPIRKVNYTVEPMHFGRETSRERLRIDVWTDGTMLPVDAISRAAGILNRAAYAVRGVCQDFSNERRGTAYPPLHPRREIQYARRAAGPLGAHHELLKTQQYYHRRRAYRQGTQRAAQAAQLRAEILPGNRRPPFDDRAIAESKNRRTSRRGRRRSQA